jgi:hypothetical protein
MRQHEPLPWFGLTLLVLVAVVAAAVVLFVLLG